MTHAELLRSHANLAIKEGGMYYSGEYLSRIATAAESLEAENAKLRELLLDVADVPEKNDKMTATDGLLPCPFCGGNCICVNVGIYVGKSHESVTIKCDDCGASIWGATEEKAIAAWNRRAQ